MQKVRIPACRKEFGELAAGLNINGCAMVGVLFGTTILLCLGLHRGVCCKDTGGISLVQWVQGADEFLGGNSAVTTMLIITNMRCVQ